MEGKISHNRAMELAQSKHDALKLSRRLKRENTSLRADNEKLKEGLRFYADSNIYKSRTPSAKSTVVLPEYILVDVGERARAILKEVGEG